MNWFLGIDATHAACSSPTSRTPPTGPTTRSRRHRRSRSAQRSGTTPRRPTTPPPTPGTCTSTACSTGPWSSRAPFTPEIDEHPARRARDRRSTRPARPPRPAASSPASSTRSASGTSSAARPQIAAARDLELTSGTGLIARCGLDEGTGTTIGDSRRRRHRHAHQRPGLGRRRAARPGAANAAPVFTHRPARPDRRRGRHRVSSTPTPPTPTSTPSPTAPPGCPDGVTIDPATGVITRHPVRRPAPASTTSPSPSPTATDTDTDTFTWTVDRRRHGPGRPDRPRRDRRQRLGRPDLDAPTPSPTSPGYDVYRSHDACRSPTGGTPLNGATLLADPAYIDTTVVNGTHVPLRRGRGRRRPPTRRRPRPPSAPRRRANAGQRARLRRHQRPRHVRHRARPGPDRLHHRDLVPARRHRRRHEHRHRRRRPAPSRSSPRAAARPTARQPRHELVPRHRRRAPTCSSADFEDNATGLNHPVTGTTADHVSGVWHHAAVTYDTATDTWNLYLDGVLDRTLAAGRQLHARARQHPARRASARR